MTTQGGAIITSLKGGVGKDVIFEGTNLAAKTLGLAPQLIEIESEKRLGLLYPNTTSIIFEAPKPELLYENPDIAFEPFDKALDLWRASEFSLTCIGANILSSMLVWAMASGAKALNGGTGWIFCIVLTMNRSALSSGLSALYDVGVTFPHARRVAILNDVHSSFVEGDRHLALRLEEARGKGQPIETIRIKRCAAATWGYVSNMGNLEEILKLDPQILIEMGLPEGPVYRSQSLIANWITDGLVEPLKALLPLPADTSAKERRK